MHLVREMIKRAEDFELDPSIHKNCKADVQFFCADVSHGKGQVHDCLRRNFESLWASCRDAEFKEEVRENQDARFVVGLLAVCRKEKQQFCEQEDPDSVLPCLQDHVAALSPGMGRKCVNAVAAIERMQMQSVELNHPLYVACRKIVETCTKRKKEHDAKLKAASEGGRGGKHTRRVEIGIVMVLVSDGCVVFGGKCIAR